MNNVYYVKNKGNIIAFPERNSNKSLKFSDAVIGNFIHALVQKNVILVKQLIAEHGANLATIQGNYFTSPLLIASRQDHLEMVNLLLENGACAKHAMHDPRAKYIPTKMKNYLKSVCQFGPAIWDKIESK